MLRKQNEYLTLNLTSLLVSSSWLFILIEHQPTLFHYYYMHKDCIFFMLRAYSTKKKRNLYCYKMFHVSKPFTIPNTYNNNTRLNHIMDLISTRHFIKLVKFIFFETQTKENEKCKRDEIFTFLEKRTQDNKI